MIQKKFKKKYNTTFFTTSSIFCLKNEKRWHSKQQKGDYMLSQQLQEVLLH